MEMSQMNIVRSGVSKDDVRKKSVRAEVGSERETTENKFKLTTANKQF